LIYRLKEPKTATLLSKRQGRCTGAKSLEHVKTAIDMVSKQIERPASRSRKNPEHRGPEHRRLVGPRTEINLNAIAISLGTREVEYEPEQFQPVYRSTCRKVVRAPVRQREARLHGTRKPWMSNKAVGR